MARTLYQKLWDSHVIPTQTQQAPLLYVDRHLLHEVTSPQAFSGLREAGRTVRAPHKCIATMDHNVSTQTLDIDAAGEQAKIQMQTLAKNCAEFGIELYPMGHERQGIVHVIGPELGITQPGMVIVCGDSHTATHGALGALAFGIGTSEVEHVLASQTLRQHQAKTMKINIDGQLGTGVSAKDVILAIAAKIGHAGATGHVIEFCGEVIRDMSIEGRMTICNMAIELGAKAGLVAPDKKTLDYVQGRPFAPKAEAWQQASQAWLALATDEGACYDCEVHLQGNNIRPHITWGTNPGQVIAIDEQVPSPHSTDDESEKQSIEKALAYMSLKPGQRLTDVPIDVVFIGSCTNSRIEDLRQAAHIAKGKKVANNVKALVVPGSYKVREQAEKEGLDKIFTQAGFEWRLPGCSMCLGMNDDVLTPYSRCASTSNRNFEGRQGRLSRTHLVSPAMAAAAAVAGHFVNIQSTGSTN